MASPEFHIALAQIHALDPSILDEAGNVLSFRADGDQVKIVTRGHGEVGIHSHILKFPDADEPIGFAETTQLLSPAPELCALFAAIAAQYRIFRRNAPQRGVMGYGLSDIYPPPGSAIQLTI